MLFYTLANAEVTLAPDGLNLLVQEPTPIPTPPPSIVVSPSEIQAEIDGLNETLNNAIAQIAAMQSMVTTLQGQIAVDQSLLAQFNTAVAASQKAL